MFLPVAGNAQETLVTKSGQAIIVKPNGEWEFAEFNTQDNSEDLFSASELSITPFELPDNNKYVLTDEEIVIVQNLINKLQFQEADFLVKLQFIKNEFTDKKEMKKTVKDLDKKYETASKWLMELKGITKYDMEKRNKTYMNVKKVINKWNAKDIVIDNPIPQKLETATFELDNRTPHQIIEKNGCQVIFSGYDNEIKKNRIETKESTWFTYTHPKLMNHFKENSFLTGSSSLMNIEGDHFLNLRLTLATKDAKRSYGHIEANSMMRITLINGEHLYLFNGLNSTGKIEAYTGNTIYQCVYPLKKEEYKELKNKEVDKVGLMWTTGFEEYEVYEVDFIQNQITCLKNGTK